ncbi:TetR/AcrR family transcriptional regulator [Pseudonocardia sp. Cha107L01]|uniref:TetR/AcrR family transcriptional regulator n=1 Tax=Pseudonocardia sp. Cha107L01 TaxID=3457576 RepID=UPI00403E5CF6
MVVTGAEPDRARGRRRGDLRSALVAESFGLLSESGLAGFSVAELARRLKVSTAAPYRHFRDRDALLAAVATRAAGELTAAMRAAVAAAGPDPVDRFAATAGAYVRFVSTRGAGFDVIFAPGLRHLHDSDLAEAGRELMALLLDLAQDAHPAGPREALQLLEQVSALAHGYATLDTDGFLSDARPSDGDVATRATRAAAGLVRGGGPC